MGLMGHMATRFQSIPVSPPEQMQHGARLIRFGGGISPRITNEIGKGVDYEHMRGRDVF